MNLSKVNKLGLLLAVAVVGGIVVMRSRPKAVVDPGDSIGTVHRQTLIQKVTTAGQIWPQRRMDIKPPYTGYIRELFVHVGQKLKERDPIIVFSPSLAVGEPNFPLRASFDGVVTQVLHNQGEYLTETGDTGVIVRVDDISHLLIIANVAELDIAKVKIGQDALIHVSAIGDTTYSGKIQEINLAARDKDNHGSASTDFQVKVAIDSHDPRLLPGMSTLMDITTARRENALVLAHEYIQVDGEDRYVILSDGTKRPVKLGLQTEEAAEIVSGLSENDRVRLVDFLSIQTSKD